MKIHWNKTYIPQDPAATQLAFLMLPHKEAFYGGAAGGMKSSTLLMIALQYADVPGHSSLVIRRTLTELKQADALLDRAKRWLNNTPARYIAEEHTYEFPTTDPYGNPSEPARLQFGYLGEDNVEQRYQGAAYQDICVDELGHFEDDGAYRYLFSRLRKNVCPKHKLKKDPETGEMIPNYVKGCKICDLYKSVPLRMRAAGNPGGPGHSWIKNRFQISKRVVDVRQPNGSIIKEIQWYGADPERPFIPSRLTDNPFIDQRGYRSSLQELDEVRRQQLEHGDWDISPDSRFNVQWAKFYSSRGEYFRLGSTQYHLSELKKIFITSDLAATVKDGPIDVDVRKGGPSYTVISVWGLTEDYHLIWIHMKRFREEIPYVVDQVVDSYKRFKVEYVKMETNGVGLGPTQWALLRGVQVVPIHKHKDKFQNATNALIRMKNGRIWFPEEAPWLKTCMDEVFTWTGHPGTPDDIVDTLSDAANDVTWEAQGQDPIITQESRVDLSSDVPMILKVAPGYAINPYQ